jgi:hypothetical protein
VTFEFTRSEEGTVMTTAAVTTDDARAVLIADEFGTGWQRWNLQAWLDFVMVKILTGRVCDVIPKTYMPILRLVCDDPAKADADYARVVALRERVRLLDSPREKWRKMYGSYIRELEWVYGELHRHLPTREYEDLVIDIMARTIRDWLGAFLPSMEAGTRVAPADGSPTAGPHAPGQEPSWIARKAANLMERAINGPIGRWVLGNLNPASFMVGPVEMTMMPHGELEMYIPRCWMHTAPCDGRTQDRACMQGCKGACERIFGPQTMAHMVFEPHLPEYSCTLRAKLGGGELAGGEDGEPAD